jgi:hypothetical protein
VERIQQKHLQAGLEVWRYCEESVRYVFGNSLGDPVADDLLRALKNAAEGLTRTNIRDLFSKHQTAQRIGQALALLLELGKVRQQTKSTGGRPEERWFAI